jgi:hypothetical protein
MEDKYSWEGIKLGGSATSIDFVVRKSTSLDREVDKKQEII